LSTNIPLIQSERKLDGLHGLRAVAALAVVLFHLQSMPSLPLPHWLSAITVHFYLSVQLFFVISAFSLYHSSRYSPANYSAYLVKRFFRIAPLYYVLLAYVVWRVGFPGAVPARGARRFAGALRWPSRSAGASPAALRVRPVKR